MTIRVFVSYRRSDSRHATGRLRAVLAREFGRENVFYDVDSVGFGADFREVINATLQGVDALIVVVGPNFELDRLSQPNDYVRMEILEALRLGKGIVPVLVDEATMPGPDQLPADLESFAYRNTAPLRADPDFDTDAARLVRDLRRSLQTDGAGDVDVTARLAPPSGARISDPTEAVAPGPPIAGAVMGPVGRLRTARLRTRRSSFQPLACQLPNRPSQLAGSARRSSPSWWRWWRFSEPRRQ